jgi:ADP-ribosylglycohydrolase
MRIPPDYVERVYAGVLGKMIGVYLGRPFEGWTYEQIMARLGEIREYVHDHPEVAPKQGGRLVVTDDDISGTFTFVRALADYGSGRALTSAQIGQTWLNYIVEKRTTLWWGGMGNSTEHTAYLRLKQGVPPPRSGAASTNSRVVAEQIGAQIFIDGWAMVAPGDPELAANLAGRAARVSHDGEAVYAAQLLAVMEALAFVEPSLDRLLDAGLGLIPRDSIIYRLVSDVRAWHAALPDWRAARERIAAHYGYDRYPGNCHVVPNHALIHLGLLYGRDDFQRALMVTNTAGWDTDCNSGNVGCLLGIKNGLAGIANGPDWRSPVADRLYLPSADGGRAISDAVTETYQLANLGRGLAGEAPLSPKGGARFHFTLPGSVQGFRSADPPALLIVENAGARGLALRYHALALPRVARAGTPTFMPPAALHMPGYGLMASPTLYPGQVVRAVVEAATSNAAPVTTGLYLRYYGAGDALVDVPGPSVELSPGDRHALEWRLADPAAMPTAEIGLELSTPQRSDGTVYLDYLTWDGAPSVTFERPTHNGTLWQRAWVDAVDHFHPQAPESFRLSQDEGTGMLITGTREWTDYEVSATLTPHLLTAGGIAARVQGLRRYYALLLCSVQQTVRLVKALDGDHVLAEAPLAVAWGRACHLRLRVLGERLAGYVDGRQVFEVRDLASPLASGGIALVVCEGTLAAGAVAVRPIGNSAANPHGLR